VLTPNLFVKIACRSARRGRRCCDDTAIVTQQDRKFVYVVDPTTKRRRASGAVGRYGKVAVIEGVLKKGRAGVVEGAQRVQPGGKVAPRDRHAGYCGEKKYEL